MPVKPMQYPTRNPRRAPKPKEVEEPGLFSVSLKRIVVLLIGTVAAGFAYLVGGPAGFLFVFILTIIVGSYMS